MTLHIKHASSEGSVPSWIIIRVVGLIRGICFEPLHFMVEVFKFKAVRKSKSVCVGARSALTSARPRSRACQVSELLKSALTNQR